MWLPKILLVILSSWRLEGKNVLSEQKPVDEKYPPPPPAPVLPDPAAPPKLSAMDIESMKAWGMTDKQIQDALAFSSKAVDEEEEASLSMLVNLLSEQELNSITEMSETEMAEFFRELAEDRRLRSSQNTSITDHSEQRGRVRQLLFAFIKDPPSQKRRRRQAENPPVTLLQKTKLYEESKKAREPTLSQFEIKTMANSMKSTLGRIQGIVDREKQHRHERRRRAAEDPVSVPVHSSATVQTDDSHPRSPFPLPTGFKPAPLKRMARSLFHDDAQEEEERVVPTYHVPDFVPSPQFLSETINVRERRSTDVLIDEDMLKDVYSPFDFHSLDEQQDEAWSLQSALRGGAQRWPEGSPHQTGPVPPGQGRG